MRVLFYILFLFSLGSAINDLHASELGENHFVTVSENNEDNLERVGLKIQRKQIQHMLTLLEKSGRLGHEEVVSAKRSLASLDSDELEKYRFQIRDLINN